MGSKFYKGGLFIMKLILFLSVLLCSCTIHTYKGAPYFVVDGDELKVKYDRNIGEVKEKHGAYFICNDGECRAVYDGRLASNIQ